MSPKFPAIALSLVSGFLIAVMVILNASLGRHIGVLESSFVVHLVGAVFGILWVLPLLRNRGPSAVGKMPKHLFLGGVLGVLIVLIANAAVPRLGMVATVGLFLAGNLFFAAAADHFGLFHLPVLKISRRRMAGLASALTGLILVLYR